MMNNDNNNCLLFLDFFILCFSEVYDEIPDGKSSHCCKCCKTTCCRCAIFWLIVLVLAGLGGAAYGIYFASW